MYYSTSAVARMLFRFTRDILSSGARYSGVDSVLMACGGMMRSIGILMCIGLLCSIAGWPVSAGAMEPRDAMRCLFVFGAISEAGEAVGRPDIVQFARKRLAWVGGYIQACKSSSDCTATMNGQFDSGEADRFKRNAIALKKELVDTLQTSNSRVFEQAMREARECDKKFEILTRDAPSFSTGAVELRVRGVQSVSQGYCYAEYSSPDGEKMFTLAGEKQIQDCRKFHWTPFRTTFFASCPKCKVDREDFFARLSDPLQAIAIGQPAGWPYEIKGDVRMWYGGTLSRDDALKICREHANTSLVQHLGSRLICVE